MAGSTRQQVLNYIRKEGRPTVREIQVAVGLKSTSTVWHHLESLKADGLVTWEPDKARTIRITDE